MKFLILKRNLENPKTEPNGLETRSLDGRKIGLDGYLQQFLHLVIIYIFSVLANNNEGSVIMFVTGLASPGLIINEGELQKAERDRDAHQSNASERRQTLIKFEDNLRDISLRQRATELSIVQTEASLTSVRFVLDKLKSQDPAMRGFGDKIRNITTYLTVCQGQVSVIYSQQKLLILFEPLLKSIDELVLFLESNRETTSLLAEKNIVEKIRKYMKRN